MGSGKGNKHAGQRSAMKNYVGSKFWHEAQRDKARIHAKKKKIWRYGSRFKKKK